MEYLLIDPSANSMVTTYDPSGVQKHYYYYIHSVTMKSLKSSYSG